MNATKDECDGWVSSDEQLPDKKELVLVYSPKEGTYVAYRCGEFWRIAGTGSIFGIEDSYWRELPEPPKPNDAFEAWWNTLTPDKTNGHEFRYVHHDHGMVVKFAAKAIWEAAINSTKQ